MILGEEKLPVHINDGITVIWETDAQIGPIMDTIGDQIADMAEEEFSMMAMLIFEEVFTNIANYAYPKDQTIKPVRIKCQKLIGQPLCMEFYDNGVHFDPTVYKSGELGSEQIGGHGIRIIKEMSSVFEYTRINDQNILKIVMKA